MRPQDPPNKDGQIFEKSGGRDLQQALQRKENVMTTTDPLSLDEHDSFKGIGLA